AALSVLRRGAGDQVGVDRGVDAGAAPAVGGVAVAVVGEEAGRGELAGQGLGPAVRGRGVAGGADDDDRGRALRLDAPGLARGLHRPVRAVQGGPREALAEDRGRLLEVGERLSYLVRGREGGRE